MGMLPFCGRCWRPTKTKFSVTGSTETTLLKQNAGARFLETRGCVFLLERMEVPKGNRGFQTKW